MHSNVSVIHAYRHLYRGLLKAVQYSTPARYIARDQLRAAFREAPTSIETSTPWDAEGIKRTLWFLNAAAKEKGMEHKILKNLIRVKQAQGWSNVSWRKKLHDAKSKFVLPPSPL